MMKLSHALYGERGKVISIGVLYPQNSLQSQELGV